MHTYNLMTLKKKKTNSINVNYYYKYMIKNYLFIN